MCLVSQPDLRAYVDDKFFVRDLRRPSRLRKVRHFDEATPFGDPSQEPVL
jgi:hypothetical protein